MNSSTDNRRVALLLNSLGGELAESAIQDLGGPNAEEIRALIRQFQETPPDTNEINRVLDEFESFMRYALQTANAPTTLADQFFQEQERAEAASETGAGGKKKAKQNLKLFTPTDDPTEDLQTMTSGQIAGALIDEHVQTIGLVLSRLSKDLLAETVDRLPEEKQSDAFFASQQTDNVSPDLIDHVVRKTVEKASLIEPEGHDKVDEDQKTADLLRALPKKTRSRLMEELEQTDAEKAQRLQELLYVFEDIVLYDNRSIQKLLGQTETDTLVVALEGAETEVSDRIFENLSKRASATLQEEMEFKQASSEEEVAASRNQIAQLISQLDRNGELTEL